MKYIQKDDIQSKVSLDDVGGVDWYDFPQIASDSPDFRVLEVGEQLMSKEFWIWKTAVLLSENDLDCLYRTRPDSHYLIAEFSVCEDTKTVVQLGNIDWDSIPGDPPIGFFEIDSEDEQVEYGLESS